MSIKTRIEKLEQKLLPPGDCNIPIVICEVDEAPEQAYDRLGINPDDGVQRIAIVFG